MEVQKIGQRSPKRQGNFHFRGICTKDKVFLFLARPKFTWKALLAPSGGTNNTKIPG